ncbi:MAG: hypothetical protein EBU89_04080 [Actinobacteria bacterium]|nr:hypothetical protein [Actinomycetota bacterium]NBO35096.1 hypothetical protein [Actinomycetota bacterium]
MELSAAISEYEQATAAFIATASKLTEIELDKPQNDSWNARQVVHHVADSEAQSYARLRRLIAEPGTQIQSYDEAGWGENETLGYKVLPVEISLAVFRAVRASSLEILKRLKEEQLENAGIHTESGKYTLETWLKTYINHPIEHEKQIRSGLKN